MTIEKYLKEENARLSNGGRWLVWDVGEWVVREHRYRQRVPSIIYSGGNLDEALKSLTSPQGD